MLVAAAAGETEAWFNQRRDLADVESWLMRNHLCHSSALLRRSTHDRVGTLNRHLLATADYELWLRCLAYGARLQVLEESLTFSRRHESNAWRRISRSQLFLELAYLFSAHLAPLLAGRGREDLVATCLSYLITGPYLAVATAEEREATEKVLLGHALLPRDFPGFAAAFGQAAEAPVTSGR